MNQTLSDPPLGSAADPGMREDFHAQARALVKDLFEHDARIYWADFVLSMVLGYAAVALYLWSPAFSLPFFAGLTIAAFALFRCGVFMHEIVHMPKGRMPVFRAAWNILFAIPFLMPSFMYVNHADHHNPRHFGTARDGEYLTLHGGPMSRIVGYFLQVPLLPALAMFRFLVLTPLSFVVPRLRRWVWAHASSYVINPGYRRSVPDDEAHGRWIALEAAIFVELAVFAFLLITGKVAWAIFVKLYVLGMVASGLNWVRTLAAHGYRNSGEAMSFLEQIEDSNTVVGPAWLTELLFPVGLRYHCLHHMFPALPYHALGTAHARLMARLPADSPYRSAMQRGLMEAVVVLWRSAGAAGRTASGARGVGNGALGTGAVDDGALGNGVPAAYTARRKR